MARQTPSFVELKAASPRASRAARATSKKKNSKCELLLRRELWRRGFRYRVAPADLPGRPDLVFPSARVVVFCDGDFWHGRALEARLAKLARGHNAPYWTAKVRTNVERDQRRTAALREAGWTVIRLWEFDILKDVGTQADVVAAALAMTKANSNSPSVAVPAHAD